MHNTYVYPDPTSAAAARRWPHRAIDVHDKDPVLPRGA
jgi:hypothetical protein